MPRLNIDEPLWDQGSFIGRFKHFAFVTDPRLVFARESELIESKQFVERYRTETEPTGTTEQAIRAKKLYESAFHPDSGDLQNVFGRMSFQMPGGMIITGAMLQWYKYVHNPDSFPYDTNPLSSRSTPAVVFWQWVNQSFNALVNYTNRNAKSPISTNQLLIAYVSATTSALATSLYCKAAWSKMANPIVQRYVPFAAVAAANCVNIPMMRQLELVDGIEVSDGNGNAVGQSRMAAVKGISQVVFSRIFMAAPGMLILPIIMERLEKLAWMKRVQALHGPLQIVLVGGL